MFIVKKPSSRKRIIEVLESLQQPVIYVLLTEEKSVTTCIEIMTSLNLYDLLLPRFAWIYHFLLSIMSSYTLDQVWTKFPKILFTTLKLRGARNVTFRNFHIDDLQISVAHFACPSDYVAHKILPSNKTQEFIILFKTPLYNILEHSGWPHSVWHPVLLKQLTS